MLILYNFIWLFILPFIVIRLFIKSIKSRSFIYLSAIWQRFGFATKNQNKKDNIWLHAVSMGEVKVALAFIDEFNKQASYNFILTTTTDTGLNHAKSHKPTNTIVNFTPFDFLPFTWLFLSRIKPKALIIVETEIWPNFINLSHRRKIPTILLNGRMSNKSLNNYLRFKNFFQSIYSKFSLVLSQYQNDSNNFIKLGVKKSSIIQTGNIKFDFPVNINNKISKPNKSIIWTAGSTRNGEEKNSYRLSFKNSSQK